MSMPEAGQYVVFNCVPLASGQRLAIIFNGLDKRATVRPYSGPQDFAAVWSFTPYCDGRTMTLNPWDSSCDLEAAWGEDSTVNVLTPGGYVWTVRATEEGYVIKDGGDTVFWGLETTLEGEKVHIGSDLGAASRWILERINV